MLGCLWCLPAAHLLHTFHGAELLDEGFQVRGVVHHHGEHAAEQSVVRVDADGAQQDVALLADDGGDVRHDADVVVSDDAQRDGVLLALALAGPAGLDDAVGEAGVHLAGIGAVAAVDLDAAGDGHEAEHLVTVDGVAAFGQLEVESFQVLVDDEHVVLERRVVGRGLQVVALGAAVDDVLADFRLLLLQFEEAVEHVVGIELFHGDVLVEFGHRFVAQFLDEAHHHGFVVVHLAVLELAFQGFFGELGLPRLHLLQGLADLGAGLRGGDDVQPVAFRRLGARGHHFHLVAAMQGLAQLHVLAVDAGPDAARTQFGVDGEGKVEHGGPLGHLVEVAFGGKHEYLVLVEFQLELVHHFEVTVGILQRFADGGEPFIQAAFSLHTLVAPVRCQSAFGDVVHAFGPDLHLHPFALRAHHGGVERFVAVAFGHRQPVAQSFGVGHVHVRHDGVHLPAFLFFAVEGRVEDDADGEEVVHALEGTLLLLHLLVDGVDGLGASLHVELQSGFLQLALDGLDELGDVGIARRLRLVQFIFDVVIDAAVGIFQRQVLEFRFQFVESQLVGQRGIEVGCFIGHFGPGLQVGRLLDLAHQVHAVGNHDEDDPHVLGEREEQVAEVFRFDGRALGIEFVDFHQAPDDARYVFAVLLADRLEGAQSPLHRFVEHDAQDGSPFHADFLGHDDGRLHVLDDGVHAERVARQVPVGHRLHQVGLQLVAIVFLQGIAR